MSTRRDLALPQSSEDALRSAKDVETVTILAQADRDCDAGLGLRGRDAKAFLERVLNNANARAAARPSRG
jgi:hypothetical protein